MNFPGISGIISTDLKAEEKRDLVQLQFHPTRFPLAAHQLHILQFFEKEPLEDPCLKSKLTRNIQVN